jgi:hypothetical protein
MKLEKILDNLNSFEKNSFLKIVDSILSDKPKNFKEVEKILSNSQSDLKNIDNLNVSKVFHLLEDEFYGYLKKELLKSSSQLDVLIDIITRDGNSIMKLDWFARLYEKELASLNKKIKEFGKNLDVDASTFEPERLRDYLVYQSCLSTAYQNDDNNNQERKVTSDEQSILNTLSYQLGLSQEEIKLINYQIIPLKKMDIDSVINELKSIGVILYSKKTNTIYIADEMIRILRKIRGKEIADKFFRRVLKLLREPQLNLICKQHGIDWKLSYDEKIKEIINEGISFRGVLINDIHKVGTKVTDKKKILSDLCDRGLDIKPALKGSLLEEKVDNLIAYFEEIEKDEKVGISIDGYEKLLIQLEKDVPKINNHVRSVFELQEENVMSSSYLLDYNIKPRDIIELISTPDLEMFCTKNNIKTRGDIITNVLDAFKDAENLFLENYERIGKRDLAALKDNGILLKEADLGVKFEDLTKSIFSKLGFEVDEVLRKKVNTAKDKIDIIVNLGNNEVILIECKTAKESGYNKFSSVSRQLKSYANLLKLNDFKVIKSLLVAPDFSDEFVKECGLEYELNLSLISAGSLLNILNGFKESKLKVFPHNLLMRDVQIDEQRVLKAILK